jgi:ABC-type nitrate/sulfonate/bicarbonate transport system substrate-binding protein
MQGCRLFPFGKRRIKQDFFADVIKKIRILLFSIVIFLAVITVQPPSLPAQERSLYVLYSGINANYLSLWLAKDAHYFADEGLNVQAVHVRGAAPVVQNLMAGQSQLG